MAGPILGRARLWRGSMVLWLAALATATGVASERDTYRVKSAFRDVVGRAMQSTVRVLCDGRRAALGAIVYPDGYILTKASEVKGDTVCLLSDGRQLPAKLVGVREDFDLAMLKIEAQGLPTVPWRESEPPPVGSWLATAGMGTIPVAIGVVSAKPRKIERQLPALGVVLDEVEQGPKVHQVVPHSGAARAGVLAGDIITHLEGKRVTKRDALIQGVRERRPGEKVTIKVRRGDQELTFEVLLGEMSLLMLGSERDQVQNTMGGRLSERRAGFPVALQHDTVLEPNQCGGPVVDLDGRVIGINIARASRVSSYAIPASAIQPILKELKSGKLVSASPAN
jgi:serine protease Do